MVKPYGYARQKFWEASLKLVGDGNIRERLGYAQSLLIVLNPDRDLPLNMRDPFRVVMADMEKSTVYFSYKASIVNARRPRSGRIAETIFKFYTSLQGGI